MVGIAYRTVYIAVLLIFTGNALRGMEGISTQRPMLIGVVGASLALALVVAVTGFSGVIKRGAVLASTSVWLVAFIWFAWFYTDSPFLQHESHSLDLANAALESQRYTLASVSVFCLLFLWFTSFPLVGRHKFPKAGAAFH